MKYFVEKSEYNFGGSQFMEVSEVYGNSQLGEAHEINIIKGYYSFHLYILPWRSNHLLCVWFNYDLILNVNHWDNILGIPKFLSPNEFHKYRPIMIKPFPNYIYAYDRGRKNDYSSPALCRIEDPGDYNQKKWCLCISPNSNDYNSLSFLEECNRLLRYLIQMLSELQKNNIDWKDRALLNIKEGVKMGVKAYFQPLSMLSNVYMDIDWGEIAKTDPNW